MCEVTTWPDVAFAAVVVVGMLGGVAFLCWLTGR